MSNHQHHDVLIAIAKLKKVEFFDDQIHAWMKPGLNLVNPITHPELQWRVGPPKWQEALRYAAQDGQVVEFHHDVHGWNHCAINDRPETYCFPDCVSEKNYRIRPEPKPDVVMRTYLKQGGRIVYNESEYNDYRANIRVTFDGETGKLKAAEVL